MRVPWRARGSWIAPLSSRTSRTPCPHHPCLPDRATPFGLRGLLAPTLHSSARPRLPDTRQGSCSLRAPQRGGAAQGAGFSGTFWAPRTLGSPARRPETSLRSRGASRTEAVSCSPRRPLRQRRHGQMGPGGPALDRGGAGGRDQCEQLALVRPGGGRGFRASSSAAAGGMMGPLCEHRAPGALRGGVARPLGPRRSLRRAGPAQVQRILPAPAAAQSAAVNKPQVSPETWGLICTWLWNCSFLLVKLGLGPTNGI